jgi:uncharacterized FlaG/YvyC family protein
MKKTSQQMIDILNTRLIEENQTTRIMQYSSSMITLSNGNVLTESNKRKFCRRLLNPKTNLWAKNTDNLLFGIITEKEIKSKLSSIGGKSVQEKYGNILKQNLNTGTSWNSGTKGQNIGTRAPRTQLVKDKISLKNSGNGNGMYGVKMSKADKQIRSDIMKQKILSGEFTPNSNNRNTHWEALYNGKKYRSSWEALYQYINQDAEYESLRIRYKLNDDEKIYIVDFVDHVSRTVIEVKPRELCVGEKFNAKLQALIKWAKLNNYQTLIVDKEWLKAQNPVINYDHFDQKTATKIKILYETS